MPLYVVELFGQKKYENVRIKNRADKLVPLCAKYQSIFIYIQMKKLQNKQVSYFTAV